MSTLYGIAYLKQEEKSHKKDFEEGFFFTNIPEAVFTGCLLVFLATMTLVTISQHFGVLWIGMEATTLFTAPLIYFHRNHRSLEATWKYLLICSVGIALALLGNLFLIVASSLQSTPFLLSHLLDPKMTFHTKWLQAAFLFFFVGYGTKMGLAPLHTWLPDAHSEAPSMISALLSGALLNCAFLGVLRCYQVCVAAHIASFAQDLLLVFGVFSLAIAAIFILKQVDYKRMLAYSSVEHMGILSFGIGIGGGALFGSLFHAINHSLTKASLFWVSGNILALYKTKKVNDVQGLKKVLPWSATLWILGFFAITGTPPSATFVSKWIILKEALTQGHYITTALFLLSLGLIFIGMARIFMSMFQGNPTQSFEPVEMEKRRSLLFLLSPTLLLAIVFLLGIYLIPGLESLLHNAALQLEGHVWQ
jgi:hydrogenase-4 component F